MDPLTQFHHAVAGIQGLVVGSKSHPELESLVQRIRLVEGAVDQDKWDGSEIFADPVLLNCFASVDMAYILAVQAMAVGGPWPNAHGARFIYDGVMHFQHLPFNPLVMSLNVLGNYYFICDDVEGARWCWSEAVKSGGFALNEHQLPARDAARVSLSSLT